MSHIFNIDKYYENNAKAEGWSKNQFIEAAQKLEDMPLDDLRVLVKKIGNSIDTNFFETAPSEQLILYIFSDIDRDILIKELHL